MTTNNRPAFSESDSIRELMQRDDTKMLMLNELRGWSALALELTENDGLSLCGTVLFVPGVSIHELCTESKSTTWQ